MINYFIHAKEFEEYKAGQVIFEEGTDGNVMYAIKEGQVDIIHNGKTIETLNAGEFFGEMALVDQSPRSANAIAKTDCKIIVVNQHRFLFLVQETPTFALQVMHVMSERVRRFIGMAYN
jgi:CRP-like cAMP-binding protein